MTHKKRTRRYSCLAISFFCVILTCPSNSEEIRGGLKAAVAEFPPISYYDNEGKVTGISPDYIRLLSTEMGIDITIERMPYARMLQSLNLGETDFAFFYRSSETKHIVDPLVKINQADVVVVGNDESRITEIEDIINLRIALPRSIFINGIPSGEQATNLIKVGGYRNAVRMLASGRVDAIVGPIQVLKYEMARLGPTSITLGTPYTLKSKEVWLQFSKNSQNSHLKSQLTQSTVKLIKQKEFHRIRQKYFSMQSLID